MRKDERQSLARAKRAAHVAQRSVDVLGDTATAYRWLTTPCAALRGKAPIEITFDVTGARRVASVLRRRSLRQRSVRQAWLSAVEDEAGLAKWLWKRNPALGFRQPATLLDTDRGAAEVLRSIRDRKDLRAAQAGATEARRKGTISWSEVRRQRN